MSYLVWNQKQLFYEIVRTVCRNKTEILTFQVETLPEKVINKTCVELEENATYLTDRASRCNCLSHFQSV